VRTTALVPGMDIGGYCYCVLARAQSCRGKFGSVPVFEN
jgi:hypothetical protein